jgi:peptide chain release factor 3
MTWPVGMGQLFRGVWDIRNNRLLLPGADGTAGYARAIEAAGAEDAALAEHLREDVLAELREQMELAAAACPEPDLAAYREGHLTPVYFGSALRDFGVPELLAGLAALAPPPRSQPAEPRAVTPEDTEATGFVFKVQANMDPNHRDRIAFLRLCSGRFRRGMRLSITRTGKSLAASWPRRPSPGTSSAFPTMARSGWAIRSPKARPSASPACPTSPPRSSAAWC